ncbi:hypothetical protein DFP72DRAFT_848540 [Ephemerocybe angulata]|uniref:Uncharacterized protein n=1 Tax=Ephemerocybe angulata TaxID=980116 RepID=A0A8H6M389_9AGAR|nr:hypothetical protein DFP72DRAFT_848540 [Tulosesus angulatus]
MHRIDASSKTLSMTRVDGPGDPSNWYSSDGMEKGRRREVKRERALEKGNDDMRNKVQMSPRREANTSTTSCRARTRARSQTLSQIQPPLSSTESAQSKDERLKPHRRMTPISIACEESSTGNESTVEELTTQGASAHGRGPFDSWETWSWGLVAPIRDRRKGEMDDEIIAKREKAREKEERSETKGEDQHHPAVAHKYKSPDSWEIWSGGLVALILERRNRERCEEREVKRRELRRRANDRTKGECTRSPWAQTSPKARRTPTPTPRRPRIRAQSSTPSPNVHSESEDTVEEATPHIGASSSTLSITGTDRAGDSSRRYSNGGVEEGPEKGDIERGLIAPTHERRDGGTKGKAWRNENGTKVKTESTKARNETHSKPQKIRGEPKSGRMGVEGPDT